MIVLYLSRLLSSAATCSCSARLAPKQRLEALFPSPPPDHEAQDPSQVPGGQLSHPRGAERADEAGERAPGVTAVEELAVAAHPCGRDGTVDRDAGLVDGDAIEALRTNRRLQGDQTAIAVAKDQPRPGRALHRQEVLALLVDPVVRPEGPAAGSPAAPVHYVHAEALGQHLGEGQVVDAGAHRSADDDHRHTLTAVRPKVASSVRNVTETRSRTMSATGLGIARV